jgi:hypothetical protein
MDNLVPKRLLPLGHGEAAAIESVGSKRNGSMLVINLTQPPVGKRLDGSQ